MTDELVERLRAYNDESFVETLCGEAADRIEQLTAERDRLREMVQASVSFMNGGLTAEEWNEVCMRPWQPPALKGEAP